jgi:hypothetical protein
MTINKFLRHYLLFLLLLLAVTSPPHAFAQPAVQAVNLSTRMRVQTGDRVGIGGFMIEGTVPKRVLIRALGPSLTHAGIVDVLADPMLALQGPLGFVPPPPNNNWKDTQRTAIEATLIPPTNDLESAILATLNPGSYTAIVSGNGATALAQSGVALVEVYDLDQGVGSRLANISTRAFVGVGGNVVIAGFLLGNGSGSDTIVVRGIGPSLPPALGLLRLADPTLELRDSSGTLLIANNDWDDDPGQAAAITLATLAPATLESALIVTLPPGLYTALLAGLNNGTGIGLVEVYDLAP